MVHHRQEILLRGGNKYLAKFAKTVVKAHHNNTRYAFSTKKIIIIMNKTCIMYNAAKN